MSERAAATNDTIDWSSGHPMDSAPRDGRVILLGDPDVGIFPMRWNPNGHNGLVQHSNQRGIWELSDGSMTWIDDDPEVGPTRWWHEGECYLRKQS